MTGRPANIADDAPIIFLKTVLIELGPFEKVSSKHVAPYNFTTTCLQVYLSLGFSFTNNEMHIKTLSVWVRKQKLEKKIRR